MAKTIEAGLLDPALAGPALKAAFEARRSRATRSCS